MTDDITLPQLVRKLALFLAFVLLFEGLLIAVAPRFHSGSVLRIAKDALFLRVGKDSSYYMAQGYLAWKQHPNALYETVFFQRGIRFIYPPTALLLYRAWQAAARIGIPPSIAMNATLLMALLATMAVAGEFLLRLLPERSILESKPADRWKIRALVGLLAFFFLPIIDAYNLGQVQTFLNFMLMAAALLWLRGSRVSPALLIGLTCWLKPQMILFVIWGLLRRQWRFTTSLAITFFTGVFLSVAVFGWHNSVEYVQVLQYLGHRGDSMFWNQSLNGLLHRLMHVGSIITSFYGYPPFNRTIYLATILSSATMVLLALIVPMHRKVTATTADFLMYAMACTMASPIVWQHHYGVFFLVFLLWIPQALQQRKTLLFLVPMYLLMTDTWAPLTPLMFTRWTFLISHVYFGGLALFLYTLFREQSNDHSFPGFVEARTRD
ncbi:MAG: glycosyltransferase family 87 protein [Acidobacteriaceae bacterium]